MRLRTALCAAAFLLVGFSTLLHVRLSAMRGPNSAVLDQAALEEEAMREALAEWPQLHPERAERGLRPEWKEAQDLAKQAPWRRHAAAASWAAAPLARHQEWLDLLAHGTPDWAEGMDEIGVTPTFRVFFNATTWGFFKPQVCLSPDDCARRLPVSLLAPARKAALRKGSWGRYDSAAKIEQAWQRVIHPDTDGMVLGAFCVGLTLLEPLNLAKADFESREHVERVVFDFLTHQADRALTRNSHNKATLMFVESVSAQAEYELFPAFVPGSSLVYIDNGRTFFEADTGSQISLDALSSCRFASDLPSRLRRGGVYCAGEIRRHGDPDAGLLEAVLRTSVGSTDPFVSWLDEKYFLGLRARAEALGKHIDQCLALHDRSSVLVL
eukprot:m.194084 g.194084  ORF g.194084 m.194084 type:complete len:383 (+) comp10609_c0_seq1:81-1229(+)